MGKYHNYVVFDCETGGLDKKAGLHGKLFPITEIALLSLDGQSLSEITRFSSLIKGKVEPNFKSSDPEVLSGYIGYDSEKVYQKMALTSTGISVDLLEKSGNDFKEVCSAICSFFEESASGSKFHKIILVGHNVVYDIPFLQELFRLCRKDLSKYIQGYMDHNCNFTPVFFDTQFLSRAKSVDESAKHNLSEVSKREGVELIDAHRAMNDVIATSSVFKKYINAIRNSNVGSGPSIQESSKRNQRASFQTY